MTTNNRNNSIWPFSHFFHTNHQEGDQSLAITTPESTLADADYEFVLFEQESY